MTTWIVHRAGVLIPIITAITVLLAAATTWLTISAVNQETRLTRIEQSPCTEASDTGRRFAATEPGRTCNRVRRDIAKRESLRN